MAATEKNTIHTLTINDTYSRMFPVGTVLHRACYMEKGATPELCPVNFEPTDKGTVMARMQFLNGPGWEPHVYSAHDEEGVSTTGMVVFLDVPPDEDWTHLIVSGCSKKMREPIGPDGGKNDRGMCLFAKAAPSYNHRDYLKFRKDLGEVKEEGVHYGIEQALKLTAGIWPKESRPGERRLLVERNWLREANPTPLYDFAHLLLKAA